MQQLGHLPYSDELSDIWGWADNNGNEYALVGTSFGLSVVDVTVLSLSTMLTPTRLNHIQKLIMVLKQFQIQACFYRYLI